MFRIKHSFYRLAQIMTITMHNQTHAYIGKANTIECVRSLGAKNFTGFGEPPEAELWFVKLELIFYVMKCSEETIYLLSLFNSMINHITDGK